MTPDPVVLWSRPFVVANGLTNLVAYVQNPNINYVSKNVPYLFRVYDKNNVLIGTREGVMDIPPIKTFAVFEPAFNSGQRVPATAFFDFTAPLVWQKFNDTKPEFDVSDTLLLDASSTPHITATLNNDTINKYRDVEVVVIVYDDQGNAQASSRTVVDEIDPSGSAPLTFTWPSPFDFTMSKIEIIPKLPLGQ